jgi:hypothetical protein
VPPPDTRAGVTPPATIRSRASPATVARVSGIPLSVARAGRTPRAVAPLAVACVGGTPRAVAPLAVACVGGTLRAVARTIPPVGVRAGAFPRPSRAPRILAEPSRPAVLARAHGAILKICYKIVNKLHEDSDHVS